jgi:DUF4097 and DUF4098 domain-containing protein YvlB
MKYYIFTLLIFMMGSGIQAQEKKETLRKELDLSNVLAHTLWIDNINGSITVEVQNKNTVSLEIDKSVRTEDKNELETAWQKLNPVFLNSGDTIEVYIDGYCECDCNKKRSHYWHQCDQDHNYDFSFDFKVRVPESFNLWLATVNEGDVRVTGSNGKLKIRNINGGIFLEKVAGITDVHTINGDVSVKYTRNPEGNSSYYTLNGKLTVYFQKDLSADMSFKSFNGDFFTDFEYSGIQPSHLVTSADRGNGTKYTIEDKTVIRTGTGGIVLDFETFNGDIYIRKL